MLITPLGLPQELIDNSLDAKAENIDINIINGFLIIKDDGEGIHHLENIFTGDKAKKGKKGCKNNGFLDSLAFLTLKENVKLLQIMKVISQEYS